MKFDSRETAGSYSLVSPCGEVTGFTGESCNCIQNSIFFLQQHGSVFWKKGASETLKQLHPDQSLHQLLQVCRTWVFLMYTNGIWSKTEMFTSSVVAILSQDSFSVWDSPVWMDSSSTLQCQYLQAAAGGALRLAEITGSRAYEVPHPAVCLLDVLSPCTWRFSVFGCSASLETKLPKSVRVNLKPFRTRRSELHRFPLPQAQLCTLTCLHLFQRISLVSSFAASLFLGGYAAIDHSDGTSIS